MNNIPCEIIKDLIPLYIDDVCSKKSRIMVEEHLTECEHCQIYLKSLKGELPSVISEPSDSKIEESEVNFIKTIKHRLTAQKWIFSIMLLLIAFFLFFIYENPMQNEILNKIPLFDKRIDTDAIEVTELYQLENGNIYCTLKSDTPYTISTYSHIRSNTKKFFESYKDGYNCITFSRSRWEELFGNAAQRTQDSFIIPLVENENGVIHESIYFYFDGKKDKKIDLWKEGDSIKQAPAWIEEKVANDTESGVIFVN